MTKSDVILITNGLRPSTLAAVYKDLREARPRVTARITFAAIARTRLLEVLGPEGAARFLDQGQGPEDESSSQGCAPTHSRGNMGKE